MDKYIEFEHIVCKSHCIYSAEKKKHLPLNIPKKRDEKSGRWYSRHFNSYTDSRDTKYDLEADEMDISLFWEDNPDACYRESVEDLDCALEDDTAVIGGYFLLTEYDGDVSRNLYLPIGELTTSELEILEEELMYWHRTGELRLDGVEYQLSDWKKNEYRRSE